MMFEKQSKNTLILDILQILEKYSDVSHRLTQHDIIQLPKSDYFSETLKKDTIDAKINKLNSNMKGLNINIGKFVKDRLKNYNFNDDDFENFKVLLDQLLNVIKGIGPFEEIG